MSVFGATKLLFNFYLVYCSQNILASKKHNCNISDIVLKKMWRLLILLPTSRRGAGSSALTAVSKMVTVFVIWYFNADLGRAVFIHVYQARGSAY
jgi:hypothetical protein